MTSGRRSGRVSAAPAQLLSPAQRAVAVRADGAPAVTPSLDKLATNGVTFYRAYAQVRRIFPLCTVGYVL